MGLSIQWSVKQLLLLHLQDYLHIFSVFEFKRKIKMIYKIEAENFIQDLAKVVQVRAEVARSLRKITVTLRTTELEGKQTSGELGLEREIEDMKVATKNLRKGVFKLMVLGDMKRGKSTFFNALIGENILPSDVSPCTVLLTLLRYGAGKKMKIHFNDGKNPEELDFKSFKQNYTIDPAEAKILEKEKNKLFLMLIML